MAIHCKTACSAGKQAFDHYHHCRVAWWVITIIIAGASGWPTSGCYHHCGVSGWRSGYNNHCGS